MGRKPKKAQESGPHRTVLPVDDDGSLRDRSKLRLNEKGKSPPVRFRPASVIGKKVLPALSKDWREKIFQTFSQPMVRNIPADWSREVARILRNYRMQRFRELYGVDETAVKSAISRIQIASRKLKDFLDVPKPETDAFSAAWSRIDNARNSGDDTQSLQDVLRPALSLLDARLDTLAKQTLDVSTNHSSLSQLILALAAFVEANGGRASGSNGIVRKESDDSLASFARIVKAAIQCSSLPEPCKLTDTAVNKAVLMALKKRGDDKSKI